jgi:apolipoprotein N-acyltransferase
MTLRVRSLPVDPHRGSIPPEGAAPGSGSGPGVVPRNSAKEPAPGLLKARGMRADLIALLAGALAALALPPLHVLPVLLVSFPVLLAQINAARGFFEAARRGWWFGFGYHLIGLYWITEAILFEAARFWWFVPLAVPALGAVLALFIAIPAGVAWFVTRGRSRAGAAQVMALGGGWVLGDLARQFVGTGFPWNPLGTVWAVPGWFGDVMLQPSSLVSVHGLTLATIVLACAPVLRWPGRTVCFAIFLAWIGFGVSRVSAPLPPDQLLRVVLVQGNVPQGQKWDPALRDTVFERYLHLTDEAVRAAGPGPLVVVWPETASPFLLDETARTAISTASHGEPVLAGAVRFDSDDRPRNSLFGISGTGDVAAVYDKWHLVPFGEYQPSWAQIGIQLVPGGGFASGPGPETLRIPGVPPVGPLICYEAIFPGQVVNEADRPTWMVNATNDAWFGTSAGPRQHLAAARLRAVEEGLPLLRAANTGITAAFDARGHEIARLGMEQAGFRTVQLPGALSRTIFGRFGLPLPGSLAAGVLIAGLAMGAWQRRNESALTRSTKKDVRSRILTRRAAIKPDA